MTVGGWGYDGFDAVVDEWIERETPDHDTRVEVLTILLGLRDSDPLTWLARRQPTDWDDTYLCVMHLGVTNTSLAYLEERGLKAITALVLASSQ